MRPHDDARIDTTHAGADDARHAAPAAEITLDEALVERQAADVLPDLHACAIRMGVRVSHDRLVEAARRIARSELREHAERDAREPRA